ncbi:hypothetical protein [Terrisporobacter vanillatitrophus]|uniref:hypothetical protein n=1 Tax=Terrisporobacter vanillatitrophus TaxID=3058402 RepID=UPI0033660512
MGNLQRKKDEGSYNKGGYSGSVYYLVVKVFSLTTLKFNIITKEMVCCPSPLYFIHL